ncbi:DNA-processing protein DprA [Desulfonema ishimotonii]|uniref:DNA-processing protein DprA n=1 Tax=Desulfonema ishimotonii TaxID=45657 RepID=A0A401FWU5_9BACT|nr:DNA-processing protein DprA [Desulfonema ishimotonii]GBC61435.1 DNA-processing protein DprA [Desulfonema ishimotonii]
MSDFLTNDTKAIILLCGVLGKNPSVKPLTQGEYSTLVQWLIRKNMRPEDLFERENTDAAAVGSGIDQKRFKALLGRGVQLGFAVEEWQRNGIWIISRSDKDYPTRYKKHLKDKAPPLLFGVGNRSLLKGGGIAIVGSRNLDADGQTFTRQTAELCAYNRMPVVSGGARGVDQIAMTAALEAGGITIGVLAENLLKKSLERNARNAIAGGNMILVSPYHPNARFTVGTAMGRNKLIYALADYGLVVNAEHKKGGTWAGATEELKRENALAVFIRSGANVPPGNKKLLDLGGLEWPEIKIRENLSRQLSDLAAKRMEEKKQKNMSLFDFQKQHTAQADDSKRNEKKKTLPDEPETEDSPVIKPGDAIYEVVLPVIINHLGSPIAVDELSKILDVSKAQLGRWLKKAVDERKIRKLSRPARYERIKSPHAAT